MCVLTIVVEHIHFKSSVLLFPKINSFFLTNIHITVQIDHINGILSVNRNQPDLIMFHVHNSFLLVEKT